MNGSTNELPGYEDLPVMTLEKSVQRIVPSIDGIVKYADDAQRKCNRTTSILKCDRSAAIDIYTTSTAFFSRLNDTLQAKDREALKPWFAFLKLFMSVLKKDHHHQRKYSVQFLAVSIPPLSKIM